MKVLLFIITFLASSTLASAHDVPMATFHIIESDASIKINITFDLEDFSNSLNIKQDQINLNYMQNYLNQNTSFLFNTQVGNLKLLEVKIVRDHIRIRGSFGKITQTIKAIKVENTCLNDISRHSNIIQIDVNNQSNDYRMTKKRTTINLEY